MGDRVVLLDGLEAVDAQIERKLEAYMLHRDLHACLFRGDGYYLLYRPVLDGWEIEECGEYDKQQNGCENRDPNPLQMFLHS